MTRHFATGLVDWLKEPFLSRRFFPISPPQTVFDNGVAGWVRGDEDRARAERMLSDAQIGRKVERIRCDGCMGESDHVEHVGLVASIVREKDAAFPQSAVIWCAVAVDEADGSPFSVIVARCTWNSALDRWQERY